MFDAHLGKQSLCFLLKEELKKPENILYRQGEISRTRIAKMRALNDLHRPIVMPYFTEVKYTNGAAYHE